MNKQNRYKNTLRMQLLWVVVLTAALTTSCLDIRREEDGGITLEEQPTDSVSEVSLIVAGDMMMHMPQVSCGLQKDGDYDFHAVFEKIRGEVEDCDIAIANLETTLGYPPYSGYPMFRSPDAYLHAILDAGFDVICTANNHCCDKGANGLQHTIDMLDTLGVPHLGTYTDLSAHHAHSPLIVEKNGIRIGLLNFTYGTNGLPVPPPYHVNHIDTTEILGDIAVAKLLKSDVIIAMPHWGIEYMRTASGEQRQLAEWLISHGVDHVIGGHPHVIQPFEVRDGHLTAFSLGNFVSAQTKPNTDGGAMVKLLLRKENGSTRLAHCSYLLHWVSRPGVSGRRQYVAIPASCPDSLLTPMETRLRNEFLESTRKLFNQYNVGEISEE